MMNRETIQQPTVSQVEYQRIHGLDDTRIQILSALRLTRNGEASTATTPGELSQFMRDQLGIDMSWQKIEAILSREQDTVARRRKSGKRAYQLMHAGINEVEATTPGVVFIDPQHALSRVREVQDVFSRLTGTLRVCDPYVDPRTLDLLADCTSASEFQLLTVAVQRERPFRRDVGAFMSQHGIPLAVRISDTGELHDRYIIHDEGMILIGTSLNGLGKKQSFIVEVGCSIRSATLAAFNSVWNRSISL